MRYLSICWFLIISLVSVAASKDSVTSDLVLAHIKSVGAKRALSDYFAKPQWAAIEKGIASGDDGWLRVYVSLEPVADGEAGEDLSDAVFEALPFRPFKVLPLLEGSGQYTAQQLCTFTFEAKTPDGGINKYLHRLEQSLNTAADPGERILADSCRKGIQATRSAFKDSPYY